MKNKNQSPLGREDWIEGAFNLLHDRGIESVKVVKIADDLGVTSGSFYWHFKGLPELLDHLLGTWEQRHTSNVIAKAQRFSGSAEGRIHNLMIEVIASDAAAFDGAIALWSNRDPTARTVYERTLAKRFAFAQWIFEEAKFSSTEAAVRSQLMVAYLIGESTTGLKSNPDWRTIIESAFITIVGQHTQRRL